LSPAGCGGEADLLADLRYRHGAVPLQDIEDLSIHPVDLRSNVFSRTGEISVIFALSGAILQPP
jgi:hypothetical protein